MWSKNNLAHRTTWAVFYALEQYGSTFDKSEKKKMSQLAFYDPDNSSPMRTGKARSLASQVDKIFRKLQGAKFETGINRKKAVTEMTKLLTSKDKTMMDLASLNDSLYKFYGEES